MTSERFKLLGIGLVIIFGTACCKAVLEDDKVADSQTAEEAILYSGAGRVVELLGDSIHVKVNHGPIEGLMDAMEMSFPLKNTDDLRLIAEGDSIHFEIVVEPAGKFYLIDVVTAEESHE